MEVKSLASKLTKVHIYRSAKSGRFVTEKYAEKHSNTTVKETVKKK
jgi:hypothetical protein